MMHQQEYENLNALGKIRALTLIESQRLERAMRKLQMIPRMGKTNSTRWVRADIDAVRAMFLDGKTDEQIAENLGRTSSGIIGIRKSERLHRDRKGNAIL